MASEFMLDHLFEGDGRYCQAWLGSKPIGNPKTTGVITMTSQCSYPRDCHKKEGISQ